MIATDSQYWFWAPPLDCGFTASARGVDGNTREYSRPQLCRFSPFNDQCPRAAGGARGQGGTALIGD